MILASFHSGQGKSHIKHNTPCQDASLIKRITGTWHVMATADGVGSCRKADIGSVVAVETAVSVCINGFPIDGSDDGILALLRTAFNAALRRIEAIADENNDPLDIYDTTLDVVIYNGYGKLYYGHSGDGGIFVLGADGIYKEITTVQEGEDANSVVPLRAGNAAWDFGTYRDSIGVVAAFTDGIRDKLVPNELKKQKYTIDVPVANKFMFVDMYGMSSEDGIPALSRFVSDAVNYAASPASGITDDFTIGILVNTDVLIEEPSYEEPDRIAIKADQIESLYPDRASVDQLFRRHLLERYIDLEARDRFSLSDEEKREALDRYYPLTSSEEERYMKKYHGDESPAKEEREKGTTLERETQTMEGSRVEVEKEADEEVDEEAEKETEEEAEEEADEEADEDIGKQAEGETEEASMEAAADAADDSEVRGDRDESAVCTSEGESGPRSNGDNDDEASAATTD